MTTTPSSHDGAELRALMDELQLDPAGLSELVGMHRSTPYKWLSGAVPPPWLLVHLRILVRLRAIYASVFEAPELPELPSRLRHLAHLGRMSPQVQGIGNSLPYGVNPSPILAGMDEETSSMTPADFKAALAAIQWRQADFARHVGCDEKTASRWSVGHSAIPKWVAVHLDLLRQIQELQQFVQPKRERKARGGPT